MKKFNKNWNWIQTGLFFMSLNYFILVSHPSGEIKRETTNWPRLSHIVGFELLKRFELIYVLGYMQQQLCRSFVLILKKMLTRFKKLLACLQKVQWMNSLIQNIRLIVMMQPLVSLKVLVGYPPLS